MGQLGVATEGPTKARHKNAQSVTSSSKLGTHSTTQAGFGNQRAPSQIQDTSFLDSPQGPSRVSGNFLQTTLPKISDKVIKPSSQFASPRSIGEFSNLSKMVARQDERKAVEQKIQMSSMGFALAGQNLVPEKAKSKCIDSDVKGSEFGNPMGSNFHQSVQKSPFKLLKDGDL